MVGVILGSAVVAWGLATIALCAVMLVELVWEVRIEWFRARRRR